MIANVIKAQDGYYSILGFKIFKVGSEVTIHFLNAINIESVCPNGFVIASGINPDIGRLTIEVKSLLCKAAYKYGTPKSSTSTKNMKFVARNTSHIIDVLLSKKALIATLAPLQSLELMSLWLKDRLQL